MENLHALLGLQVDSCYEKKIVTLRNISMLIKFLVAFEAIVEQWE